MRYYVPWEPLVLLALTFLATCLGMNCRLLSQEVQIIDQCVAQACESLYALVTMNGGREGKRGGAYDGPKQPRKCGPLKMRAIFHEES